jgi:hypothetical protein
VGSAFDGAYRRRPTPDFTSLDSPACVRATSRGRSEIVNDARRPGAEWISHSGWLVIDVRHAPPWVVEMRHPAYPHPLYIRTGTLVDAIIWTILRRNGVLTWKRKYDKDRMKET